MDVRELFRISFAGVAANRVRSALTVLGILIGVASVVVLVAVGNGSSIAVKKNFDALGTNTLTVRSGSFGPGASSSSKVTMTMSDVEALQSADYKESISTVVPSVNVQGGTIAYGESSTSPQSVTGTTADMESASNWKLESGRFFSVDDVDSRERVIVLGSRARGSLFAATDRPVGQKVLLNKIEFEVIGVLKSKGSNGFFDQDDVAYLPWTTARDTVAGGTTVDSLSVVATSSKTVADAEAIVTDVISGRHPQTGSDKGFLVLNASSLLSSSAESSRTLTVLLAAVAAISLLVGGIGIMNIMLVTVTERTREIGIRKAVGAPKSAILGQFLLEATLLGGLGGVVGVGVGLLGSVFKIAGTVPVVRYDSVVLALTVSVLVSLFFGIYPANRAASLRPIDALRHE